MDNEDAAARRDGRERRRAGFADGWAIFRDALLPSSKRTIGAPTEPWSSYMAQACAKDLLDGWTYLRKGHKWGGS
jgi:hypothetical protein